MLESPLGRIPFLVLQELQREYDKENYALGGTFLPDLRHMTLHLTKLTGKLATQCEQGEHDPGRIDERVVREEVVPDLLFHALHLANLLGVDLVEEYEGRLRANLARLGRPPGRISHYVTAAIDSDPVQTQVRKARAAIRQDDLWNLVETADLKRQRS